jgi:hypothetical protein
MTSTISKAEIPSKTELQAALPVFQDEQVDVDPPKDVMESNTVDVSKALTLRLQNKLSYRQIATQLNVSKSAIWKRLKPFEQALKDPGTNHAYDDNRAMLLNALEMGIFESMVDGASLKKASFNNQAYGLKIISEARRLEKGESTANISHHHMTTEISEIDKELRELEAERGGL